jgi:hypothetical protein
MDCTQFINAVVGTIEIILFLQTHNRPILENGK